MVGREDKGDEWCLGEFEGKAGYFPGNYVQRIKLSKRTTPRGNVSPRILQLAAQAGLLDPEPGSATAAALAAAQAAAPAPEEDFESF